MQFSPLLLLCIEFCLSNQFDLHVQRPSGGDAEFSK
jgi:hypothetical protein